MTQELLQSPSWTELRKGQLKTAQVKMLKSMCMTEEEYYGLMFDIGCRFARAFSRLCLDSDTLYKSLVEDPEYRYWNWFKTKWSMDDESLLKLYCFDAYITYQEVKEVMISDPLYQKDLYYLIAHKL